MSLFLLFAAPSFAVDWSQYSGVLLLVNTKADGAITFCTAVAVAPDLALTAAHCLENDVRVQIYYGEFYPSDEVVEAREWRLDPAYNRGVSFFNGDLGWVRFAKPAQVATYGFATAEELAGLKNKNLDRVTYSDNRTDDVSPGRSRYWTNPTVIDVQPTYLALSDQDARHGDSGSPLFFNRNGRPVIAAIHSTFDVPTQTVYGAVVAPANGLPWPKN